MTFIRYQSVLKIVIILLLTVSKLAIADSEDDDSNYFRPPLPEDLFLGRMVTKVSKFKAIKISGGVVVTDDEIENVTTMKFCDHEHCKEATNIMKVSKETGLLYVKVLFGPYHTTELVSHLYRKEPSLSRKCRAYSFDNDEGIPVSVTVDREVRCEECEHLDAIFCRHLFVGVLIENENETLDILPFYAMLRFAEANIIDEDQIMKEFLLSHNVPLNTTQVLARRGGSSCCSLAVNLQLLLFELFIILTVRFAANIGLPSFNKYI